MTTRRKPKVITIDYKNAKLYTIRSPHTKRVYIGATTQTLALRLGQHKNKFKRWKNGKYNNNSSFEILQAGGAYIELLRECPCDNKEQLCKYEGEAIRDMVNCCNMRMMGRTKKGYYEDNKDRIKRRDKERYEKDKEAILQQRKQYREDNKEVILQKKKQYREDNKEVILQKKKQYYEANKEAILQRKRELRLQKKTAN